MSHEVRIAEYEKELRCSAPLSDSQHAGGNPGFDHQSFLFLNLKDQESSSLLKDRFTATSILFILWRAAYHSLFYARTAKRNAREIPLLSASPLNPQKADNHYRCFWYKMVTAEDKGKWESEKFPFHRAPHCLFAMAPQVPHQTTVNLLFIQNHPQNLIDSYKLIEWVCGAVSSFILLIQFKSLSLPEAHCPCCSEQSLAARKGPGTTGS